MPNADSSTPAQPSPSTARGSLALDRSNLSRDEAARRSAAIEVASYHVHVDLSDAADLSTTTYPVSTRIEFAAQEPETFLDYLGDQVRSLRINGTDVDVQAAVGPSRLHLWGLQPHNVVEIESASVYSRSGEGLHRFSDPADGKVYLYTQYEPADSRRVFPVFEQPDLKARFRFSITGPSTWELRSNGAEVSRSQLPGEAAGLTGTGLVTVAFAETPPMSSYITALLAGPYHRVDAQWDGSSHGAGSIDLALLCRESLAPHFDADELADLTRRGLDFFHREFAYPYPWGKYDQVFVPEYNLGAMENPGLVTFTESYVFDTAATQAQHESRAETLFHEMAHMWFGDLVTMGWWDDLWLKESFADYMGSLAVDEATDWSTAWIAFANGRKAWAYVQDQLPTTHPIVADIPDLEAADQNFDGITYAKGASVLKQLAAFAGREAFRSATRTYFAQHAFGNASLGDFLACLEEATGQDMRSWAQAWLQTAGVPVLAADQDDDGVITVLASDDDPATGGSVARPHVVEVGVHSLDASAGQLTRQASQRVTLDPQAPEGLTAVQGLIAPEAGIPRLLLPNDEDLTYAKLSLDPDSVAAALTYPIADPLARATVWASLWSMVRDADLPAGTFVEAVMRLGLEIPEVIVVQSLLRQADQALASFTPEESRSELEQRFAGRLAQFLTEGSGGDLQRAAARCLARISRREPSQLDLLATLLDGGAGELGIEGLTVDEELRWSFLQALAAHGRADADALDRELGRRTTARARIAHRLALAARPDDVVKSAAFEQALSGQDAEGAELSNDHLTATIDGFRIRLRETVPARSVEAFIEEYFASLEDVWSRMSQGQATRVVEGLFPGSQDLGPDELPENHDVVVRTRRWLDEHIDAPSALRRIIVEELDHLLRRLRAQHRNRARSSPASSRSDPRSPLHGRPFV